MWATNGLTDISHQSQNEVDQYELREPVFNQDLAFPFIQSPVACEMI